MANLYVGMKASITKLITKQDVELFSKISGDQNPIHFDEEYAKKTRFKKPIVQGMLTGSLVSALIGNKLPGPGAIYVYQSFHFLKPVYIGDEITAEGEIMEIDNLKKRLKIKTICYNQMKEKVLEGEAIVLYENL